MFLAFPLGKGGCFGEIGSADAMARVGMVGHRLFPHSMAYLPQPLMRALS
jgi:hypothetical protein